MAIERPIGDLDSGEFLSRYWQKEPLLVRGGFPDFRPGISPEELAGLACEPDVESRLVRGNESDGWRLSHGPFEESDFTGLPDRDWTLLVQDVDKHVPHMADLLDAFSFIPAWRIDDLMISFAADDGSVGPHVDAYDVFLLQASGRRRWCINPSATERTRREDSDLDVLARFEPEQEWILEPGDLLYLPPGVPHHGISMGEGMTFSIGFRAPSHADMLADFMGYLIQKIGDEPRYADPDLHPSEARDGALHPASLARIRRDLLECLAVSDHLIDDWFGRFITETKPWLRPEPPDPAPDLADIDYTLDTGQELVRDTRALFTWTAFGDGAILFVDGRAYELRRHPELARMLCGQRRFSAAELSDYLDNGEAGRVIRDLVAHGELVLDDDD